MTESPGGKLPDLYRVLAEPVAVPLDWSVRSELGAGLLGPLAAGAGGGVGVDLAVVVRGWQARTWMEQHAQELGVITGDGDAAAASCRPCARHLLALLRGAPEQEAFWLACERMRRLRGQIDVAQAVVDRWARKVGG